ncbi:hypothetical protein OQA88_5063 [Cercophora sp. LCS_1]
MASLSRAVACFLALGTVFGQAPSTLELDLILPRNETYRATEYLPIVFAARNLTAIKVPGNVSLSWGIMPYGEGWIPGGIDYDEGEQILTTAEWEASNLTIYADASNVSAWIYRSSWGDKFMLTARVAWSSDEDRTCEFGTFAQAMFSIDTQSDEAREVNQRIRPDDGNGIEADPLKLLTECPAVVRSVLEIGKNETRPNCPPTPDVTRETQSNSCPVRIDRAAATSIASEMTAKGAPTPTRTRSRPSTTNAAVATAKPGQAVLAAACILGGLIL